MSEYKFEDLPNVVATLAEEIKSLRSLIDERLSVQKPEAKTEWMTLKEFQKFHPEHPAAPTVYGWIRNGLIPYYKKGKKLFFKTAEIEQWLNEAKQQSAVELEENAINYINNKRIAR